MSHKLFYGFRAGLNDDEQVSRYRPVQAVLGIRLGADRAQAAALDDLRPPSWVRHGPAARADFSTSRWPDRVWLV